RLGGRHATGTGSRARAGRRGVLNDPTWKDLQRQAVGDYDDVVRDRRARADARSPRRERRQAAAREAQADLHAAFEHRRPRDRREWQGHPGDRKEADRQVLYALLGLSGRTAQARLWRHGAAASNVSAKARRGRDAAAWHARQRTITPVEDLLWRRASTQSAESCSNQVF